MCWDDDDDDDDEVNGKSGKQNPKTVVGNTLLQQIFDCAGDAKCYVPTQLSQENL